MQQISHQENLLKQQLRTFLWQNNNLSFDLPQDQLREVLDNPQALIWLDIEGDCSLSESLLRNVFKLQHITVHTMGEEHERAKFVESVKTAGNDDRDLVGHATWRPTVREHCRSHCSRTIIGQMRSE